MLEVLQDLELRMTQAILASHIGKKNKTEFLRGELERMRTIIRATLDSQTLNQITERKTI